MKKTLLLLICSALMLTACGKGNQANVQVNNVNSNPEKAVVIDTAKHNVAFEQALNNNDQSAIKANLNYIVDVTVNNSDGGECALWTTLAVSLSKSVKYDFDQNQEIVQNIKSKFPSFKNLIVGLSSDDNAIVYSINKDNKVDKIFFSAFSQLSLDEPGISNYSIEQHCKLYPNGNFDELIFRGMYLTPMSDFSGEIYAKSDFDGKVWTDSVAGKLPNLADDKFYQAWLSNEDKNPTMFSLGKLVKDRDFYVLTFENVPNKDLRKVIISEETTSDNKMEKAVMQGVFVK